MSDNERLAAYATRNRHGARHDPAVSEERAERGHPETRPASVRHRWKLERGGQVDILDLGFGVLTLPAGRGRRLLDEILPAETLYAVVAADDDLDLATR